MPTIAKDALSHHFGLRDYFHVQRFCFACIGIDPLSLVHTYFNYCLTVVPLMLLLLLCFLIAFYAVENLHDLDKLTNALSPFWQSILSIFKLMYFICNSKRMVSLIRKLWSWNLEVVGDDELTILAEENRKDNLFCNFYHIAVLTTGILALMAPLVIAAFYKMTIGEFWDFLEPPLKATYFVHYNTFAGYAMVFVFDLVAIHCIMYGALSMDSLFSWFMCNIVAHLRILKFRIERAAGVNHGASTRVAIVDFVAYHGRIIELANEFNRVFSSIVFIKFTISCIQICCLAFQISRGGLLADQLFRAVFLVSVSTQLILYCYNGQRVQDESISVANQIYESFHWEALSVTDKKLLIIPMMRAQRPCYVSGIFFVADLSLYLWVYRTAASFIAVLRTLDE